MEIKLKLVFFVAFLTIYANGFNSKRNFYKKGITRSSFIIDGKPTKPGEFPWMVRIIMKGMAPSLWCGGSLIASNVVLSAGHCVMIEGSEKFTNPPDQYEVIIGDWDINKLEPVERHIGVKHILHNSFNWNTGDNDISMLILKESVPCAENLRPIALPFVFNDNSVSMVEPPQRIPLNNVSKTECIITGWGATENGSLANELLQLQYPGLINPQTCQKMWNKTSSPHMNVHDGMVCAKSASSKPSTCHGDSGGPLVCKVGDGTWRLFGLTSWGSPFCGDPNLDVFTDVGYHLSWIYQELSRQPDAFKGFWQSMIDCASFTFRKADGKLPTFFPRVKECDNNNQLLANIGFYCPF